MLGSEEDPEDGQAVASAVFGAVFVYIVRFFFFLISHFISLLSTFLFFFSTHDMNHLPSVHGICFRMKIKLQAIIRYKSII